MARNREEAILERLRGSGVPLAIHEMNIKGYSENTLATGASNLAAQGLIFGVIPRGERYKIWAIVPGDIENGETPSFSPN